MLGILSVLLAAAMVLVAPLRAQTDTTSHATGTPRVEAVQRSSAIALDGKLDEEVWSTPTPATNFIQQDPDEGKPATQRTEVRFAYDAEALYVGARMYDSLGTRGVRSRLARRDQQPGGDYLMLVFDTFHDHSGRTIFQVNPSGVKYDAGQASPSADPSWDPVWETVAQTDSLGWTAEIRIPFSQLRFPRDSVQTWGLQVWRYVERLNETSMWSFWKKDETGGPARFGHLEAIRAPRNRGRMELLPYTVTRASYVTPTQPGSPFQSDSRYNMRVGADLKYQISSTLTLDATINPDFGQVEVDPAVVNLSAFETFFQEKRPFFVEGSGLFGFGSFWCYTCSNVSSMSLFYSRRVGRAPQGFVTRGDAQFVHTPENSTILGAAKITGRTPGGLQVGLLNAVTRSERALVQDTLGNRLTEEVEPASNYFVGRVKRNYRNGDVTLGAIATSVIRRFDSDPLESRLPGHAESVGADWELWWKNRTYHLLGNFALSNASGDSLSILRLQRSSARYFQRPDRVSGGNGLFSDVLDASATALRGYGGYLRMAKDAGSWLWESQVNYRSPGFEVNDLAFLTRADYVWLQANVVRQWTQPSSWYRNLSVTLGGQEQYNFDRDRTDRQVHGYVGGQLPNYWNASVYSHFRPEVDDDRLTRGGPVVRRPANLFVSPSLRTDGRKRVVVSSNPYFSTTAEGDQGYGLNTSVQVKPATNVSLSLGPSFSYNESSAQFVSRFEDSTATHFFGQRVVFAGLAQRTLSMDTRLNVTFMPTLTLELFAQPFVASGDYRDFREFDAPRTVRKSEYDDAQLVATRSAAGRDSVYTIDPDRNPATANFSFGNPDFNLRSLRGNAVLRWEYRPGSTLFFVWQQQRSGADPFGNFDFTRDAGAVFRERPDNIFLIKASYWFGR